ncbi:MAG: DUF3800 domain-containing protein [Steroidobacteraceae bacterium]
MNRCVYLFLDEGGNFDFSPTGTRYFVLTSVATRRPFAPHGPLDGFKHDCLEYGLDAEYFHCADDNAHVRRRVFDLIASHLGELRIDSLIVEKPKTSPALRDDRTFYPKMLGYLLRHVIPRELASDVDEVIVITDTVPIQKKRQAIEKAIKSVLAEMLPAGMRYRVFHHSSRSHYGLQVADYCNWAVFRKWQRGDAEFYEKIRPAMQSEFDIFRNGTRLYY